MPDWINEDMSRSDLKLIQRALKHGYGVTPQLRQEMVEAAQKAMQKAVKRGDIRSTVSTVSCLASLDRLNLEIIRTAAEVGPAMRTVSDGSDLTPMSDDQKADLKRHLMEKHGVNDINEDGTPVRPPAADLGVRESNNARKQASVHEQIERQTDHGGEQQPAPEALAGGNSNGSPRPDGGEDGTIQWRPVL